MRNKLEEVQIAVQTEFVLGRNVSRAKERAEKLTKAWEKDCPEGVSLGKELYKREVLKEWKRKGDKFTNVFEKLIEKLQI